MIKLSKIKPNPNNPRIIKDDKFKKLVTLYIHAEGLGMDMLKLDPSLEIKKNGVICNETAING